MDKDRRAAFLILRDMEKNDAFSNLAINSVLGREQVSSEGFVREVVYGVLRNGFLLDYNIDRFLKKTSIKSNVRILLRMGFYSLAVMKEPSYAAVNETVELAAAFIKGNQGFVNAVLRNFERSGSELLCPPSDSEDFLSVKYSCSKWIVDLWTDAYGREKTEEMLLACLFPLPLVIRVNTLKTSSDKLKKDLEKEGFTVEQGSLSAELIVKGHGLLSTKAFAKGLFRVQGEASQRAVELLNPKPGDTVLDLCASPGGKTCTAAELMNNEGRILAFDIYKQRVGLVKKLAAKQGITIIEAAQGDASKYNPTLDGIADCVIADVPCSGLGVIRSKPEIKLRPVSEELKNLYSKQLLILSNAAAYVKIKSGMLLYTTCTINPEENQRLVRTFLNENKAFDIKAEKQLFPQDGTDGFYMCLLVRND